MAKRKETRRARVPNWFEVNARALVNLDETSDDDEHYAGIKIVPSKFSERICWCICNIWIVNCRMDDISVK